MASCCEASAGNGTASKHDKVDRRWTFLLQRFLPSASGIRGANVPSRADALDASDLAIRLESAQHFQGRLQ